jgi:quinol monooxygenase YgiN
MGRRHGDNDDAGARHPGPARLSSTWLTPKRAARRERILAETLSHRRSSRIRHFGSARDISGKTVGVVPGAHAREACLFVFPPVSHLQSRYRVDARDGTPRAHSRGVVRLTITLTTPAGESWRLLQALNSLSVPTHERYGCFGCQLSVSSQAGNPSSIRYVEDWSSEEDLREQVSSDRFPRLLAVMEEALVPPTIVFDLPGGTRGLDYVWEIRHAGRRLHGRHPNADDIGNR